MLLARHSSDGVWISHWRRPQGLYSSDSGGEVILWTAAEGTSAPGRRPRTPKTATARLQPDPSGRWAVEKPNAASGSALLWDLDGLVGMKPWTLRRSGSWYYSHVDFHPRGDWVVATTNNLYEATFWPLPASLPAVVNGYKTSPFRPVKFTPDGRHLVTRWEQDRIRLWSLPGGQRADVVDLMLPREAAFGGTLAIDPTGKSVLTMGYGNDIFLISLTGGEPRQLSGTSSMGFVSAGGFSPSGRLVAIASGVAEGDPSLRVWDLEKGESRVFDLPEVPDEPLVEGEQKYLVGRLAFVDETTLYTCGGIGLHRWNIETGAREEIVAGVPGDSIYGLVMLVSADRRRMVIVRSGQAALHDFRTGEVRRLWFPGGQTRWMSLGPEATIWAGTYEDGIIWVGRTDGDEVHLLAGHEGPVRHLAISPDCKWIASAGEDNTIRLWPMPDLSKPPLHTLPHGDLIAKLHSLTNLRVVRDEESSTGWKVDVGPFPGWAEVPEW